MREHSYVGMGDPRTKLLVGSNLNDNLLPPVKFVQRDWITVLMELEDPMHVWELKPHLKVWLWLLLHFLTLHSGAKNNSWNPKTTPNVLDVVNATHLGTVGLLFENIRDRLWAKAVDTIRWKMEHPKFEAEDLKNFNKTLQYHPKKAGTYKCKAKYSDDREGRGSKWAEEAFAKWDRIETDLESLVEDARPYPVFQLLGDFYTGRGCPPSQQKPPQKKKPKKTKEEKKEEKEQEKERKALQQTEQDWFRSDWGEV